MRNYLQLFYRNIKQKKRMYALEFCMIMVVDIALLGALLVCFSFVQEATKANGSVGRQQVTFSGNVPELSSGEMKKYGIAQLSRYNLSEMFFDNGKEAVPVKVRLLENIDGFYKDIVVEGEMPENDAEVLIPGNFRYGTKSIWKIGDNIKITNEEGNTQSATISGFYEYADTDTFFGAEVIKIENETDSFRYCDVIYRSGVGIENRTKKIADVYGVSYSINEMQLSIWENDDKTGLILYVVLAVIFIVICYSMIRSVASLRAPQTDKENAIIRSFGVRKKQIIEYEVLEISLVSVLASIAATFVTVLMFYVSVGVSGLSTDRINELLSRHLAISTAISVVVVWFLSLVAVLLQTKKALNRSISETLTNSQNLKVKSSRRRLRKRKNPVMAYIWTSLGRNKWKTILSIVLFASSILFFVFVSMFKRDVSQIYRRNNALTQCYDVRLELLPAYSKQVAVDDVLNHVTGLNEVENARLYPIVIDRFMNVDAGLCRADSRNLYPITDGVYDRIQIAIYSKEELNSLQPAIKDGSADLSEGGCILVNYTNPITSGSNVDYSKKSAISRLKTGDTINLIDFFSVNDFALGQIQSGLYDEKMISDYQKKVVEEESFLSMPIKGMADGDLYNQSLFCPLIILSEEYYSKNMKNAFIWGNAIDVTLKENSKLSDIADELKTLGCFRTMNYLDSGRSSMEASEFIMGLLYVIMILAALVGFIVIMCTIMIEWEISQKEYAILKSVGATTRKVRYVIGTEKAIICFSSCVFGIAAGIVIERVLMIAVMRGKGIPLSIPFAEIVVAITAMLIVTVVSAIIQSSCLNKMNLSEVMNKAI